MHKPQKPCAPLLPFLRFVVVAVVAFLFWEMDDVGFVEQGGSFLEQPFAVSGSGSMYALGYCDDHLRPDLGRCTTVELKISPLLL